MSFHRRRLPSIGFPAGVFFDIPSQEVPCTSNGRSLLPLDAPTKRWTLEQMPYGKPHLELTSTVNNEDPGTVIHLENAARTRSALYLQEKFYSQTGVPKYGRNGGHLELAQGRTYCWTPLNMEELAQYLRSKGRTDLASQVFLRRNRLPFFWFGELRFKFASRPFQTHPSVAGIFWNKFKYCLDSEQPPRNARQYAGAIIRTIRDRDYNANFSITPAARDDILSEISIRMPPAGPAGGQGQVVGVGPHPDQGAATGSVEGQPEPEQLPALPVAAADQATGVEPDQGAATGSVEGQPEPEQLPALPVAAADQATGVEPQPDQGRAGAGGDGQSDQPTADASG